MNSNITQIIIPIVVPIVVAIFASNGFWQYMQNRKKAKSAETELLLGLAHDRIYDLCEKYIARGYVTTSEYDNLMYLYRPYHKCGGNGTGEKLIEKVDKLPIKEG